MIRMIALALASFILVACSEGVQLGTGQNADPVVVDFPIAYVKAPLPLDDNGVFEQQDVREQITFEYGADLYYRARAAVGADAINITGEITQGRGAIRDVEIDYDGSRLLSISLDGTVRQWPLSHKDGLQTGVLFDWGHPIQQALADMDVTDYGTV